MARGKIKMSKEGALQLLASENARLKSLLSEARRTHEGLLEEVRRLRETQRVLLDLRWDSLTGLMTRRAYEMQDVVREDERRGPIDRGCVAMVDINNLKRVNDLLGHVEADRMIAQIAGVIDRHKRRDDTAIRWGGDEFLIIFRSADVQRVKRRLKRMRDDIGDEVKPYNARLPDTHQCGVAIGCANFERDKFEEALTKADDLMYKDKAKQKGG